MSHRLTPPMLDWLRRVPKIELHLHLEGAIPPDALWQLIQKYGGDPHVTDRRALRERFRYRDFRHFLDVWTWKNGFLREYDDFAFIAEAVARELTRQRIVYVEMFFSAPDYRRIGLQTQRLAEAIRRGISQVPEAEIALVGDLVRDFGPRLAETTLRELAEVRDQGIVGIGIGGTELQFPPEPFRQVYTRARELGFRTTAHAGETAGPASIWAAVNTLEVDRIGHGTRAIEDPGLVAHLKERQVPLEMCPLSNLRTGAISSLQDHPIQRFLERGLLVTVNTDDPAMFGTSLAGEFATLEETFGIGPEGVRALMANAIRAAWLGDSEREKLAERVLQDEMWRRAPTA